MYSYKHPRPAVTVDIAIFMPTGPLYQILLIKRAAEPFVGYYALPGGFCEIDESLEQAAQRELLEETGLGGIPLIQVHTFSNPERDPRGRIISTCFSGILETPSQQHIKAADDAAALGWFDLDDLPQLAFDHQLIIQKAAQTVLAQETKP